MRRRSTRVDLACRALRQAITEQLLPPGSKLPEEALAARFRMSRPLVRDALAQLRSEGLVDAPPRRTATTVRPTLQQAHEIFEIRRLVERRVIGLVIGRWRPQFGVELDAHVRAEEAARQAAGSGAAIGLAGEFHTRLAEMTGNALVRRDLFEAVSRCALIRALYDRPHAGGDDVAEHRDIVAALRAGDADAAITAMDRHLCGVERRALAEPGRGGAGPGDAGAGDAGAGDAGSRHAQGLHNPLACGGNDER